MSGLGHRRCGHILLFVMSIKECLAQPACWRPMMQPSQGPCQTEPCCCHGDWLGTVAILDHIGSLITQPELEFCTGLAGRQEQAYKPVSMATQNKQITPHLRGRHR
jgi:hypothetical protein